jgi:DNA-binding NarL/FixJ family response regulator
MRLVSDALAGLAVVAVAGDEPERAARLMGAAEALRDAIGIPILLPADRAAHERSVASLRATLGEGAFRLAWAAGAASSVADAIQEAVAIASPAADEEFPEDAPSSTLTPRERDVLRLLVARRTDHEIAEALFLSPRTVQWHVASILGKLGAASRREAAAMAAARGLV